MEGGMESLDSFKLHYEYQQSYTEIKRKLAKRYGQSKNRQSR